MIVLKTILISLSFIFAQEFITPSKERILLRLAITPEEQQKGLSGLRNHEFKENEGMLFIYENEGIRRFWMPDTYFNLDIYFLDKNFKIKYVEKNVPHHPGTAQPPPIYVTQSYKAWHVLELKTSSKISKKLKINDVLIFKHGSKKIKFP